MKLFSIALLVSLLVSAWNYGLVSAPASPFEANSAATLAAATEMQTGVVQATATPTFAITPTELIRTLQTDQPTLALTPTLTTTPPTATPPTPYFYYAQAGDSLKTLALRFNVSESEITSSSPISQTGLIDPGQLLIIPRRLANISSSVHIIPDSEVVYSPSAMDFDIAAYVKNAGGYLNQYSEYLGSTGTTTGIEVIQRVATEFSVNPRLLLALLQYQSGWVSGQPTNLAQTDYPMGKVDIKYKGLYQQMSWVVSQLSKGYYGWRDGSVTQITFPDNSKLRLAPDLNAGSVALQYLFANMYTLERWAGALNPVGGFPALYTKMFGDAWARAQKVEPLFPATETQPDLVLPFEPGVLWSLTGGPHAAFGSAGALAALDFAPGSTQSGCYVSDAWAEAMANGVIVRAANNQVVLDLDGDGHEQTGWTILYMHIATKDMIAKGTVVKTGDLIGHPSCEGGTATGVNLHVARKYNGEWIVADSAIPFVLSGWQAHAGAQEYQGTMTQGDQVVTASTIGIPASDITRPRS